MKNTGAKLLTSTVLVVGLSACGGSSDNSGTAYDEFSLAQFEQYKVEDAGDLSGIWVFRQIVELNSPNDALEAFSGQTKVKHIFSISQDGEQINISRCGNSGYRGNYQLAQDGSFELELGSFTEFGDRYATQINRVSNNTLRAQTQVLVGETTMSIEFEAIKINSLDYLGANVLPQSSLQITQLIDASGSEPEDIISAGSYQLQCFHRVVTNLSFTDKTEEINGELDSTELVFFASNTELAQNLEASYASYSYFDEKGGVVDRDEATNVYLFNQVNNKNINIKDGLDLEGIEFDTKQQPLHLQIRNNDNRENAIIDFDLSLYL